MSPGAAPSAALARALKISKGRQVLEAWSGPKGLSHQYAFDGRHILLTPRRLEHERGVDEVPLGAGAGRFQVGEKREMRETEVGE